MIKYSRAEEQKNLFRKHRKILSEFKETRKNFPEVKIAFLSGVTYQPLESLVEVFLLENGFNPVFFLGDYNAFKFESSFSKKLVTFDPDYVYFHTNIDTLPISPEVVFDRNEVNDCLSQCLKQVEETAKALLSRTRAQLIINNLEYPNFRINGNFEAVALGGQNRFINELNLKIADLALDEARIILNDISYLSSKIGLENWRDENSYFAFKQPYTQRAQVEIARSISSLLLTSLGRQKKALVLDLDNTIWGGIIGDEGPDKVKIGMDTPLGEAYLRFQRVIRPLLNRGLAFAICSKNDFEVAKKGLEREEVLIRLGDFHVTKVNWDPKSVNIGKIKSSLNIGFDSMVFVDDSEFERNEIRFALPDVYIPDIGSDPNSYVRALSDEYVFETLAVSSEDMNRSQSFQSMIKLTENSATMDINEYLISLNMKASLEGVTEANENRVHQLINKTNQFNLTSARMNNSEVEAFKHKELLLSASLKDNSTKYGLVSALWGTQVDQDTFDLENWVMSCRVFNRKLELLIFEALCERLKEKGLKTIRARYIKSAKNKPVAGLLSELKFHKTSGDEDDCKYSYDLDQVDSERRDILQRIYK